MLQLSFFRANLKQMRYKPSPTCKSLASVYDLKMPLGPFFYWHKLHTTVDNGATN